VDAIINRKPNDMKENTNIFLVFFVIKSYVEISCPNHRNSRAILDGRMHKNILTNKIKAIRPIKMIVQNNKWK
jgi:hypothetical protein